MRLRSPLPSQHALSFYLSVAHFLGLRILSYITKVPKSRNLSLIRCIPLVGSWCSNCVNQRCLPRVQDPASCLVVLPSSVFLSLNLEHCWVFILITLSRSFLVTPPCSSYFLPCN